MDLRKHHRLHWRHTIFNVDPYNHIHEANLIEAQRRSLSHTTVKKEKKARRQLTSLNFDAARSAYDRAISTAFSR